MTQTANNYARVLYELEIPAEMVKEADDIFQSAPVLLEVLGSPVITRQKKCRLVDKIMPAQMRNFLKVLCNHAKAALWAEIYGAYEAYHREQNQIIKAVLYYVIPPAPVQISSIKDFLCRTYNKGKAELELVKKDDLIGGFVLCIDNQEYDWSMKGRLKKLQQNLIRR